MCIRDSVETAPVLALLASMGCDVAQGYLIGKPMPLTELIATLPSTSEKAAVSTSALAQASS